MKRNTFIATTTLGSSALLLLLHGISCRPSEIPAELAVPETLLPFCEVVTIREIGKAYREMTPSENQGDKLIDLLSGQIADSGTNITDGLANNIKAEFRNGETVEVAGWVLSRTEARQCALYSLLNP